MKATYTEKHDKYQFAHNEEELENKLIEISISHPELVFVCIVTFKSVYIEGYKSRSAIPFDSYEMHLRTQDYFLQNGKHISPTSGQLAKIEIYGIGRD